MTTEETNALKIFERHNVRQIYGPVEYGEFWRRNTNQKIKDK
jgi:hypothetical protein